jgi:hypothetical protein
MPVHTKTLQLEDVISPDMLAKEIARTWITWNNARRPTVDSWNELRRYIFATDTKSTANSALPWKNTTTIPKITQIRDNLHANYMAALFPKRKWLHWYAENRESSKAQKRSAIEDYMRWATDHPEFKKEVSKIVLDYIDYGNCFAMPTWLDGSQTTASGKETYGYEGPGLLRISPLDIVFNPTTTNFSESPKIIRSLISRGDLYGMIDSDTDMDTDEKTTLMGYFKEVYNQAGAMADLAEKDDYLRVDGYDSFRAYLESDYCEILTFYGDLYDPSTGEYLRQHKIMVADRHRIISKKEVPGFFSEAPIYHTGWRKRQDNLWAMGPLENLVGMQYRLDHIENLKADVFDLTAFPPIKVKGYVEEFEWGPMEKIFVGDEGDVNIISPDVSILQANLEITNLQGQMEEMAGAPKEAAGFRSPGEKTAYEVKRTENAYNRIFSAKTRQFEEFLEGILNAMLELGRRRMTDRTIAIWDDELKIQSFKDLTQEEITGVGRLRPMAAQHFAEKAEKVQNITSLFQTLGQDPGIRVHFSSKKIAHLLEELLDLENDEIVEPYIQVAEELEQQRLMQVAQEELQMEAQTPAGISPDDIDSTPPGPPQGGNPNA